MPAATDPGGAFIAPRLDEGQGRELLIALARAPRWQFWRRPFVLRRAELLYLPLYAYACVVDSPAGPNDRAMAVEALGGIPMILDKVPAAGEAGGHVRGCGFVLAEEAARPIALEYGRGLVLESAMRHRVKFTLRDFAFAGAFFYPFWIGYFERGGRFDFRVVDAVGGASQGINMRQLFTRAIDEARPLLP